MTYEVRHIIGYIAVSDGWAVYYELLGYRFYGAERWGTCDEAADEAARVRDRLVEWHVGSGRVVCIDNIRRTFALHCEVHPTVPVFVGAEGQPLEWNDEHLACQPPVASTRGLPKKRSGG